MFVIRAYAKSGELLAEFERPMSCKRAFALNKSNLATFELSITHPKAQAAFLTKGTRILILSDAGVEPWGGFIVKRHWTTQSIEMTCVNHAAMWQRRRTGIRDFTGMPAGQILLGLMDIANAHQHTGIVAGNISLGGPLIDESYRYDEVYKSIVDLVARAQMEWDVTYLTPTMWQANLYQKKGSDKTADTALVLGKDIDGATDYEEDETVLANRIYAIGTGTDWNQRTIVEYSDIPSIIDNGLAEDTLEPSDVDDAATLRRYAIAEVKKRRYPRRALKLEVNNSRNAFGSISDGDYIAVQLPGYGFTGLVVPVRVLGREIDEQNERMVLAADVVEGEEAQALAMYRFAQYGSGGGGRVTSAPGTD